MHTNRLRVLVVEDDADTARTLLMLLGLWGHDASFAVDGAAAVAAARTDCPDVVLLDLGLPGINGWEVATKIRQHAAWKRPLLVAVSGHANARDRLLSRVVGLDIHLAKPVDPVFLRQLLERFAITRWRDRMTLTNPLADLSSTIDISLSLPPKGDTPCSQPTR
jgi:CheY-like chemotaxis protein